MNSRGGVLEGVNVVDMQFIDNGRSLRLELIESVPPYAKNWLTFKNTYSIRLLQNAGDGFPLIVIDLIWKDLPAREVNQALSGHSAFDGSGNSIAMTLPLVIAHLQGDLSGDVIAEAVVLAASR